MEWSVANDGVHKYAVKIKKYFFNNIDMPFYEIDSKGNYKELDSKLMKYYRMPDPGAPKGQRKWKKIEFDDNKKKINIKGDEYKVSKNKSGVSSKDFE